MRKYRLKNKKRFIAFVSIILLIVLSVSVYAKEEPVTFQDYEMIYVKSGDTLWLIAEEYSDSKDIRKYIYEIKKINNLNGSSINPGQLLMLP